MKYVLKKRIRGRQVVLVLASCREHRRPKSAVPLTGAAVTALYLLRRLGRHSGLEAGEAADAQRADTANVSPTPPETDETTHLVDLGEPRLAEPEREEVSV